MAEGTCAVEPCEKPTKSRGWCNVHYLTWRRHGTPEYKRKPRVVPACVVEDCPRPATGGRGWCNAHYLRWWQSTDPGKAAIRAYRIGGAPCSFAGCVKRSRSNELCESHRKQQKQGKALTPLLRKTDPLARDEEGRKLCGTCDSWLSLSAFTRSRSRSDGFAARCSRCERGMTLKRKFGINLEEYEALLIAQGGGCAVCQKTEAINGRRLAVDHDHSCCPGRLTCGRCIRGLLCSSCNLNFGTVGDSLTHIEAMASYLRAASARLHPEE